MALYFYTSFKSSFTGAAALVSFVAYQGFLTCITLCASKQRKNKLLMIILGVALLTGLILSCIMITYIIEADMWFFQRFKIKYFK